MQRILSTALSGHVGEQVTVAGWVHRRRLLKSVAFVIVRDSGGFSQVVVTEAGLRQQIEALTEESVISVVGTVSANPSAPGGVELVDAAVAVLAEAQTPPVELHRPSLSASLPTLLDHAAVVLRHPLRQAIFRATAAATHGFRSTLDAHGFVEVHTPKIVASATESGANVFAIDYFGTPAYLAQSPQFYKQSLVGALERVYEVAPVFRAEPHDTVRHLASYTSLDVELGFIDDHRDVMPVLRTVLAGMVEAVSTRAAAAVGLLELGLPAVPAQIPVLHFADAIELLSKATGEDLSAEPDLAPAHERWLGEWARATHGSDFLFVAGYPMVKRPFYTHPDPDRPGYSNGFDLLFRGIELVTGGQRLHRYGDYLAALSRLGEPIEPYEGYLSAFRHGMPPHGGFAIGLERFMMRLTEGSRYQARNIREVTAFPRDMNRLSP